MCRAGRSTRRAARQSHLVVTRSHRDRRPVGWQSDVYARRSEATSRFHHLLGRQPGRVPSAPFHQVHHHAEEQVPARAAVRTARWCWWIFAKPKRQCGRHLPAGPARQGFRVDYHPAGPGQRPAGGGSEQIAANRPDAGSVGRPDRPDEGRQVRLYVLRHGAVDDARQAHEFSAALLTLAAEMNAFTKFVAMPMRGHGNVTGADVIMRWHDRLSFRHLVQCRGYPRYNPGEFSTVDLLVRGDCDAAFILGADPAPRCRNRPSTIWSGFRPSCSTRNVTHTSQTTRVHITTAAHGHLRPGHGLSHGRNSSCRSSRP